MKNYLLILFVLGACATNQKKEIALDTQVSKRDSFKLNVLKLGMPEAEVRAALGAPDEESTSETKITTAEYYDESIPLSICFYQSKVCGFRTNKELMAKRTNQRRAQHSNDNYMGSVVGNTFNQLGNNMQSIYAPKRTTDCQKTALGVTCVDR